MRTFEEITEDARTRSAFHNGSEFALWSAKWCLNCQVDYIHCPLLESAFLGLEPIEWIPRRRPGDFRCTEFQERPAQ